MKILIACEFSGTVRDAFIAKGHDAISCDILPTEKFGPHYLGDVLKLINQRTFDLMIAHPPCTRLTTSANKWYKPEFRDRFPNIMQEREDAVRFFMELYNSNIPQIFIENPKGIMTSRFRNADQYIQPFMFGHTTTKMTGLWLKKLPKLIPTKIVEPEWIIAPSGNRHSPFHYNTLLLPQEQRWRIRSRTYQGIAKAMAEQWG